MTLDVLSIFTAVMSTHGAQVLLLKKPYDNIANIDFSFREKLYKDFDYLRFVPFDKIELLPNTIYQYKDDFSLNYTFFALPEDLRNQHNADICCVGPYLFNFISMQQFQHIAQNKKIPNEHYSDLREYINIVPIVSSNVTLESTFAYFLPLMFHYEGDYRQENLNITKNDLKQDNITFTLNPSTTASLALIKRRYETENAMLIAVKNGDLEKAKEQQVILSRYQLAPRTSDSLRNMKNFGFTLNTLLRKAVEQAYVHPYYIDKISTELAIQVEASTNQNHLQSIFNSMLRKYCVLVKKHSRKQYSAVIQNALDYIDFHFEEPLSLDFLANHLSVSNAYLSSLFKKEVGDTITNYINQTRVRHAIYLLTTTTKSIQEISEACGFNDANYFNRTFKKFEGVSATCYRNRDTD